MTIPEFLTSGTPEYKKPEGVLSAVQVVEALLYKKLKQENKMVNQNNLNRYFRLSPGFGEKQVVLQVKTGLLSAKKTVSVDDLPILDTVLNCFLIIGGYWSQMEKPEKPNRIYQYYEGELGRLGFSLYK